jgi:hypothetical protein
MSLKWLCIATAALFGCDQPDFSELHRLPLWTIGPEPQLILGGDPESGAPLFRITGATKIAAGFFILNAGAHELRVYNEHGELVHTSGREGSGPEEFRNPRLVGHLPSDSLFIFDKPLNRISIVCRDLRICDSWETPASLGSVIAIRGDRVLFERIQANAMTEGVSRDVHTFTIARRGATDLDFR